MPAVENTNLEQNDDEDTIDTMVKKADIVRSMWKKKVRTRTQSVANFRRSLSDSASIAAGNE